MLGAQWETKFPAFCLLSGSGHGPFALQRQERPVVPPLGSFLPLTTVLEASQLCSHPPRLAALEDASSASGTSPRAPLFCCSIQRDCRGPLIPCHFPALQDHLQGPFTFVTSAKPLWPYLVTRSPVLGIRRDLPWEVSICLSLSDCS